MISVWTNIDDMNGRKSRLAERISDKYDREIKEKMKDGSLIGETYEIDGKRYVITDGEIHAEKRLVEIRELIEKHTLNHKK